MIDLDKIDDAKAILKKWCDDGMESISTPVRYEQLLGLMNKLAAAEKDAARYRWLDEQNKSVMSKVMVCNGWIDYGDDVECVSDLASFIDEAMQCK